MTYNYDELSLSDVTDILHQFREGRERKSDEVVEIWIAVIKDNLSKLKNEKIVIIEQVLLAALDCYNYEVIDECLDLLRSQFPDSHRVLRYEAERNLVQNKHATAVDIYEHIKEADPTNSVIRKRIISSLKFNGKYKLAIPALVDHLKMFMADVESWQELCELYLRFQEYSKAVFCAEELLLHQPHSHLVMQKVADIRYTMGGVENLELAKTYYCQAIKYSPTNLRALWGLFLATSNLVILYKTGSSASKRKDVWKLNQWAQKQIAAYYKQHNVTGPIVTKSVPVLEHMLLTMTIND